MKVAVVGARGFVGRHLIHYLSDQGMKAVPITRADIAPEALRRMLAGCDALVNCAGDKNGVGAAAREANVELPLRLLEAVLTREIPAMVHVSSVAALTSTTRPGETISDGDNVAPLTPYGRSKREGDDVILARAQAEGYTGLSVLRPPILIGNDANGVFALMRSLARAGVPLPLAGANNRRSVVHIDNFAAAIVAAIEARCAGAFIVTDSPPLSSEELYMRMLSAAGHSSRLFSIGPAGRTLLRKAMGSRGESLFGSAAFSGGRFIEATRVTWPIPAWSTVERATITNAS